MSAASGIDITPELASSFASANTSDGTRFIKVSIQNEQLVQVLSVPATASINDDLALLQSHDVLEDNTPAYVLAKIAQSDWIAISYVPDSAQVRDKMLYASTRTSLLKALGSTVFTDALFATSKADLTPEAYAAHRRHNSAPKPLSLREQELANIRAAESGGAYEGSRARVNHIGAGVGFQWSLELQNAVKQLAQGPENMLLVMEIDRDTEELRLKLNSEVQPDDVGATLPGTHACYAFFAWPHKHASSPRREIVFIYSCPSVSPIKDRMIYSSGVLSTYQAGKSLLIGSLPSVHVASRKIETSEPQEINEAHLKAELGLNFAPIGANETRMKEEKKPFAKPRGPAKKR